ncbi:MAG: hypothetical protein ACI9GW_001978 [Halieaceae bacterium]|jgi:hypothetical protein
MSGVETNLDIQVTAAVDWTDVLSGLVGLFVDPFFLLSVLISFMAGMLTYLWFKTFRPNYHSGKIVFWILGVETLLGFGVTYLIVDHSSVMKFAVVTGPMAFAFYWVLLGVSYWLKLPWLRAGLQFKRLVKTDDGKVKVGDTIQFHVSKPPE